MISVYNREDYIPVDGIAMPKLESHTPGSYDWAWERMEAGDTVTKGFNSAWFLDNGVVMRKDITTGRISKTSRTKVSWTYCSTGLDAGWEIYESGGSNA